MILAIDFTNTLENHALRPPDKRLGPPMDGAGEALQFFMDRGDTIIIFSVVPEKAVRDWMDYFDLPYHEITNKKPLADVYLDDKGLRFTSWQQALTDIVSLDGTKP